MVKTIVFKKGKFYVVTGSKNGKGNYIVLMSMPTAIHIITAALNIKDSDPSRGVKALVVATACGTSTFVIIPIGTITALLAAIAAYNSAVGAQKKAKWRIVKTSLKSIMRTFQNAMDLVPADAVACCESGGFKVKKVSIKQKNVFTAERGLESGTVQLVGNTSRANHFHAWWVSTDGINFILIMGTSDADNLITDLLPNKRYWFQHQLRMAKGPHGALQTLFVDVL